MGIGFFIKDAQQSSPASSTAKKSVYYNTEEDPHQNWLSWHPDLGLVASKLWEMIFCYL